MTNTKRNAPEALHRDEGDRSTNYQKEETMKLIIPESSSRFDISTGHARIEVQSERDYWIADGGYTDRVNYLADAGDLVRLTDDQGAHLLLSPAEALSIAAALQAVATHLLEDKTHTITRRTEPGQPAFEETI